ncbi:Crp/Fnr family transcriptional regulator [Streptomyces sp. NPDC048157]|uniref:Crp/Fnr family transcriptional regulator n=1 Tax=Streptomyces sp. NPDC048157 TaxID=3365503 RepID=UPI00371CBD5D
MTPEPESFERHCSSTQSWGCCTPSDGWPSQSFLGRLNSDLLSEILQLGTHCRFAADQPILHQGEQSNHIVLLHTGLAKVTSSLKNGYQSILAIRGHGDVVGEMAAVDNSPRSATVTACEAISACIVEKAELHPFLLRHPEVAFTLTETVAQRLRWSNRRRVELAGLKVKVRLARMLSELARSHGHHGPYGVRIRISLSQPELAALIGARVHSVHKALRELSTDGLVDTGYRYITVRDTRRLRTAAGLPGDALPGPKN